ncbi:hypothetical protein E2C01_041192 [Portunus trituberculatus]|uniref:Uncharacterized protein n=1 Tax=Portunus trituberculatus TaxID=210409 RepID=A0A5B7FPQ8_PORTR|nr:hypothetical protein [Portunus trituberculatus]
MKKAMKESKKKAFEVVDVGVDEEGDEEEPAEPSLPEPHIGQRALLGQCSQEAVVVAATLGRGEDACD